MVPKQWQAAKEVINLIEQAGFEAFIVGGAVRDYYLNKENNDVDIATSALPSEIKSIFSRTVDVGIDHGTILVLDCGEPIEVTTYRTETTYSDHRRPDAVQFVRNLEEDLKRRDFTMNAMALSKSGEYLDFYNGRAHIDKQLICAVGNPVERFDEDALRMLRAIRFAAQLNFSIEVKTFQAIQQKAATISFIAMERIQQELSKVFTANFPHIGIEYLEKSTLSEYLPGDFTHEYWMNFHSDNPQVGWAYFCLVNGQDTSVLSTYRCSNKEKQFAKNVLAAYESLRNGIRSMDLLRFEVPVLHAAYQFTQWQNQGIPVSFEDLVQQKNMLPIQHVQQLAISGKDLLDWSQKKRGAWIKEALEAAVHAVLNNEVHNDKQQLKEWFYAFHNEG